MRYGFHDDYFINELNKLLKCDFLKKMAAHAGGRGAEVSDVNFDEAFKDSEFLFYILQSGLTNKLENPSEKELFNNLVYAIMSSFKNDNHRRESKIYNKLLMGLSNKELVNFIVDYSIDMKSYYSSKILEDKKSVVKILSRCNFGEEHDKRLISRMRDFFFNDSEELRLLIYNNPQIYDKLAKIGNKPNFSDEVLKELVYVHGSRYFVSRLHESLKADDEFMRQIIIENPVNIFRGKSDKFKQRIRENAFFLFGDKEVSFLNAYGMEYILDNCRPDFIDFCEYLKHDYNIPNFVFDKLKSIVTPKEYNTLLLRGKLPEKFYEDSPFYKTKNFPLLLIYNFREMGYPYDDELIDAITYKYKELVEEQKNTSVVMMLANNIAASYVNNTVSYFDELVSLGQTNASVFIDMNILTKENIEKIGIDNLRKMAYYPNSLYILSQIIKEGSLDMFVQLVNNCPKSSLAPAIDVNVLLYSSYMYKDAIIDLLEKGQLTEENVSKLINITKNNKLLKIETSSDIINFEYNLSQFCDEQIKMCNDTNYAKEILFAKLLKTTRANAQDFILKFKDGLKEKHSPNYEMLEILQIVDSITDIDAIKQAYRFLEKYPFFASRSFDEIQNKMKLEISGEKFIGDTEIKKDESLDYLKDFCDEWGIKVIIPERNSKFKILVHVVGAYGDAPDKSDILESWNTAQRDNVSGICTSLITDRHIATAKIKDEAVVFGFKDVSTEEVLMCAPYDIFSKNARLTPDSRRRQSYIDSNNLPEYCRGAAGNYSEIVIPRYINGEKRKPDYVILFDYQKNYMLSVAVARQFDIPLVAIDTKQMFNDRHEENERLKENFFNNPTADSFIEYLRDKNSIKYSFSSVPDGHLGEKYESYKKFKISEECIEVYELVVKSNGREVSREDKEKIESFINSEKKKEKTKHYIEDRNETVKLRKKEFSFQMFKELRKEYGFRESLKIMKMQFFVNSMMPNKDDSIIENSPIQGGKKSGKK